MKISLAGAACLSVIVFPCMASLAVVHNWATILACGVRYAVGPKLSRPVIRIFHRFNCFVESMWMMLVVVAVELVAGTRFSMSYVSLQGQEAVESKRHCSKGRSNLSELIKPPRPGKTKIIMLNHHCRVDWLYLYLLVARTSLRTRLRVVLKADLKKLYFFGLTMELFAYIFLTRRWKDDEAYVRQMVVALKWLDSSPVVQIFPEGTDLSASNVTKGREFAKQKNLPQFTYVLNPRTTGLIELKEMFGADSVESIIDITLGYTYAGEGKRPNEKSLVNGDHPRKVHFLVQELPMDAAATALSAASAPKDSGELEKWIMGRFELKEQLLSRFYNTSPVGFDVADVRGVLGDEAGFLQYDQQEHVLQGRSVLGLYLEEFGWRLGVMVPLMQWVVLPVGGLWCQSWVTGISMRWMILIDCFALAATEVFRSLVNIQHLLFLPKIFQSAKKTA